MGQDVVRSKNGILVRLTPERWAHIIEGHNELAGLREDALETISAPERIVAGHSGECLAIGELETGRYLIVVYRELERDGFVITAFITRRLRSLNRRTQLWP